MFYPCLYESRNTAIEKPQKPRLVRQVSRRTDNARVPLPGGLQPGMSSRGNSNVSSTQSIDKTMQRPSVTSAVPPKGILKHPTKRFPFEDTVAVQRSTGLRFEIERLSPESSLSRSDVVTAFGDGRDSGVGIQHRDSLAAADKASARVSKKSLSAKESQEELLGGRDRV